MGKGGETIARMAILLYIKAVGKHWWALMSCALFTILGIYILHENKTNQWAVHATFALAGFCLLIACFLAWLDEHRDLLAEKSRNEGARVEGKINLALIDQKKRAPNGTVVLAESECFVTILLFATNLNPADAWFNTWAADVHLTLEIDGVVYRGKYESLPIERVQYMTTHPDIKATGIFDCFGRYQVSPMKDGLPHSGWLRFCFNDIARMVGIYLTHPHRFADGPFLATEILHDMIKPA